MMELKEVADRANRSKSDFLANMSHEIRTPMNAIIGMNYLMGKTVLSEKQADYHLKIDTSARNLLRIIDDILDFSKIEAGKLTLETTSLNLEELLSDIGDAINAKIQHKQELELVTYTDPRIPPYILGDSVRLRQVLLNLTDNAAKFTEKGEVKLSVTLMTTLPYGVILQFSISDSGIGISPEQLRKLFNPFQQADVSTTRRFGGTGLGLAICKRIVEMMDGELEVESSVGKGSRFYFNAFFSLPNENPAETVRRQLSVSGRKVLLVDDSESARMILHEMLTAMGFQVFVASDARQAIGIFEQEQSGPEPFALLVVDWKMPGMDGLQLVRELRGGQEEIPAVLMVTAFGMDTVKDAAREALVDGVLLKPVNMSSLHDAIAQLVDAGADKGAMVRTTTRREQNLELFRQHLSNKKILLVEDNDINLELALELLRDIGIEADTARDGLQAVEKISAHVYDGVLMDIQMPNMDGLTATRRVRERPDRQDVPILAMTAHAMKGEYEKSIAAGMNDHITKPIDPLVLYRSLLKHLVGEEPAEQLAEEEPLPAEEAPFRIEGLNVVAGLSRVGNKEEAYLRLLRTFAANQAQAVSVFADLLRAGDVPGLDKFLHNLTGVCGNIGADGIYENVRPLYNEVKQLAEQGVALLEPSIAERLRQGMQEVQTLVEAIQGHFAAQEPAAADRITLSAEECANHLANLRRQVADNDPTAAQTAQDLLDRYELPADTRRMLAAVCRELDDFEFDNARNLLPHE
jgi:CheY-like chemotaxis protein